MGKHFSFRTLTHEDFPLLLRWLETLHVKEVWDRSITWTPTLIEKKYGSYCAGYKECGGIQKPMQAYIALYNDMPIGYIQYYNVHDYPREDSIDVSTLSQQCAAIDFYIGDPAYIGRGLGVKLLTTFLDEHVWPYYDSCLVDPDKRNIAAIKTYKRAGFTLYKEADTIILMGRKKSEALS